MLKVRVHLGKQHTRIKLDLTNQYGIDKRPRTRLFQDIQRLIGFQEGAIFREFADSQPMYHFVYPALSSLERDTCNPVECNWTAIQPQYFACVIPKIFPAILKWNYKRLLLRFKACTHSHLDCVKQKLILAIRRLSDAIWCGAKWITGYRKFLDYALSVIRLRIRAFHAD